VTLADETLRALRNLGAGDHSTRDVWWAVEGVPLVPPRVGAVENALTELWEQGAVANPAKDRWRVAREAGRQEQLLNEDREN
jgi:hypothetical protein